MATRRPHRSQSRSQLFSLSARIRRRENAFAEAPLDEHFEDDGCPICLAARAGAPLRADLTPDPMFLFEAARRVLQRTPPGAAREVSIMEMGSVTPDGRIKRTRYTVDADGDVHCDVDGARSLVGNAKRVS